MVQPDNHEQQSLYINHCSSSDNNPTRFQADEQKLITRPVDLVLRSYFMALRIFTYIKFARKITAITKEINFNLH